MSSGETKGQPFGQEQVALGFQSGTQVMGASRQHRLAQIQHFHLTGVMIGPKQDIRIGIRHPVDLTVVMGKVIGKSQQGSVGRLLQDF